MRLRLLSCLLPALLAAACGSLPDDPAEPDALATLEGELSNQAGVSLEGDVRIAVIWRRLVGDGQIAFSVAEDVPVEPVFPSKFRVVLHNPPPEEAMIVASEVFPDPDDDPEPGVPEPYPAPGDGREPAGLRPSAAVAQDAGGLPPDLRVAMGSLVAYVDENGNGRLDLVEEGAPGFLDRVVGTNEELLLTYFEGTIPDPMPGFMAPPAPGYNFVTIGCGDGGDVSSNDGDDGGDGGDVAVPSLASATCGWATVAPPSEPFTLPVTSDPGLNDLMCTNGGGQDAGSSGGFAGLPDVSVQPAQYPSPDDPNLHCAAGGDSYYVEVCTTYSEGLCKGVVTECRITEAYRRPEPAPAAWPCPSP